MRSCGLICLLFVLVGFSVAQDTSAQGSNAHDTNFSTGPQYLLQGSSLFARPIATPSLSLSAPTPQSSSSESSTASENGGASATLPEFNHNTDLRPVYYGDDQVSVIEVHMTEDAGTQLAALPPRIFETGVSAMVDMETLRRREYGAMPSEVSAYWKAHKVLASRHYTNADIDRLHAAAN
jgi:hypothetical protein